MKTKTAGIITYWDTTNNYGSILQNYALQCFLKKYEIQPFLIRIRFSGRKNRFLIYQSEFERTGFLIGILNLWGRVLRKSNRILFQMDKKNALRRIPLFISEYLCPTKIFVSFSELAETCPVADFYIAGSDQIWNTYGKTRAEIEDNLRAYFLEFVPPSAVKIACAASFGSDTVDIEFKPLFKKYLSNFDFISVREKSGVSICRELGFLNAQFQPDPTMLLSLSEYRNIESHELIPSSPYILLYLLGNTTNFSIAKLKSIAHKRGLDVIYVYGNDLRRINFFKKTYPTVQGWLGLVDHAEAIVTNSFHGTVFSIIFNKKFMFIPQCGTFKKQNMRVLSLLEDFKLNNRIFNDKAFDFLFDPIDWKRVNKKLTDIRLISPFVKYVKKIVSL